VLGESTKKGNSIRNSGKRRRRHRGIIRVSGSRALVNKSLKIFLCSYWGKGITLRFQEREDRENFNSTIGLGG